MQQQLYNDYAAWLDKQCRRRIPAQAVAFNVNLYETEGGAFQAELIGASQFDAGDPDWPCSEVFASRPDLFQLRASAVKGGWRGALKLFAKWTRAYCDDASNGGTRLRTSKAVAVGFVDGDLVIVWPSEAAA